MEALKITLTFSAPVFIDSEYPIHMDAIIASCVAMEDEMNGGEDSWRAADDLSYYLGRTDGDEWVWKASRLMFTPASGVMFQNMLRKSEPERFFADIGLYWEGAKVSEHKPMGISGETFRINTGSGQQRGYQWLSASQWMEKAEAWVVGDRDMIERLFFKRDENDVSDTDSLHLLQQIGKVGRNGYGKIKRIEIESSSDSEKWRLRVLPEGEAGMEGVPYATVNACIRAPYWKKLNRVMAQEPIV